MGSIIKWDRTKLAAMFTIEADRFDRLLYIDKYYPGEHRIPRIKEFGRATQVKPGM